MKPREKSKSAVLKTKIHKVRIFKHDLFCFIL